MIRAFEAVSFLALAAGFHVALLAIQTPEQGAEAAGAGGEAQVSLRAAPESVARMVETWERPPQTVAEPEVAAMTPPAVTMPDLPSPAAPTAPQAPVRPSVPGLALPSNDMSDPAPDRAITEPPPPPPPPAEPQEPVADEPDTEIVERSVEPLERSLRPAPRRDRPQPPPRERAAQPERERSTASPAQRASGTGGGAHAGAARKSEAATLSARQAQSLKARWGAQLRNSVERRKRYPSGTRGVSGTVTVRLTVTRGGALRAVSVIGSSGHAPLDQAAVRAVRAARFPAAPTPLTDSSYSFTLAMNFSG